MLRTRLAEREIAAVIPIRDNEQAHDFERVSNPSPGVLLGRGDQSVARLATEFAGPRLRSTE